MLLSPRCICFVGNVAPMLACEHAAQCCGRMRRCLFWAKNRMDNLLWGKSEGDGKQLTPLQSMASGFSAACLGPVATGPFDVVKVFNLVKVLSIFLRPID